MSNPYAPTNPYTQDASSNEDDFFIQEDEVSEDVMVAPKETPLFTSKSAIEDLQKMIQFSYERLNDNFERLGDGQIKEGLTMDERNEIIDEITKISDNLEKAIPNIVNLIKSNMRSVKGLKIRSFVDPNAFDELLKRGSHSGTIKTEDINFQEFHR